MTFQYSNVNVKQECCDDDSYYSSQNFWDYELAFNDCQEDASTQTDSFTVFKSIFPGRPSTEGVPDFPVTKLENHCFHSPPLRNTTNHCYKNKSPNTVKVLMEKHRVNERLRHHCLNEQLYMICRIVPGFTDEGKETKVVMMQRIISYIAYLENTIQHLSKDLNIQPDSSSGFLTRGVKDTDWSNFRCIEHLPISSEDSRDSQVSTLSMSRRLKLSSPINDFVTDCASQDSLAVSTSSVITSQSQTDCSQASEASVKYEFYDNDREDDDIDHFDFLLGSSSFEEHSEFQVPSSSFEEGAAELEVSEVEWLGSPDKSVKVGKLENFGIKLDPDVHEEPVQEFTCADIVSPDQVLPQTSLKRKRSDYFDFPDSQEMKMVNDNKGYYACHENVLEKQLNKQDYHDEECQVVPNLGNKRKLTPQRHPFTDMGNIPADNDDNGRFGLVDNAGIPMASNFMEVESSIKETNGWEAEDEESEEEALKRIRSKVLEEASQGATLSKLDLRKSSWLNGFMMYSQVHRRRFIRDNPGVHTAQISKMMGQAWRDMSQEEQQFYREHAKLCSQDLQRVLDQKLFKCDKQCSL